MLRPTLAFLALIGGVAAQALQLGPNGIVPRWGPGWNSSTTHATSYPQSETNTLTTYTTLTTCPVTSTYTTGSTTYYSTTLTTSTITVTSCKGGCPTPGPTGTAPPPPPETTTKPIIKTSTIVSTSMAVSGVYHALEGGLLERQP